MFASLLSQSGDSGGGAIGCFSHLDAATAARCLGSISLVRDTPREKEREKRRPFGIPSSNGNVCTENKEALENA